MKPLSALLEIKNIETFYVLIYALRGVSLTVDEGTITAVLGNNGAGKSTVLKTVMGLLDDQPDKGTIEWKGPGTDCSNGHLIRT
jgi:branched-chain amino acid transport system ATP-binding protein